jgi:hypothetical protein
VKKTTVAAAFPKKGDGLTFLFDYGDEWLFQVELTGTGKKADKTRYPRLVGSKGDAPDQYPAPDDD